MSSCLQVEAPATGGRTVRAGLRARTGQMRDGFGVGAAALTGPISSGCGPIATASRKVKGRVLS